jgi:hypothetical protein
MPNLSNIKVTIGMESTPGTAVTTTAVIPIKGLPTLSKKFERKPDELITGNNMEAGEYSVATNVGGQLPLSPRACAGMGKLIKASLGLETSSSQIGGAIRIRYSGSQASCKMVVTATTITSNIGALGSETADSGSGTAGFGTSGVVTLSSYNTLGALQTYLATFTNYATETVMGASSASTTAPGPITITSAQAAGKYVYIYFQSSTSGVYVHTMVPDLTANERPSTTIQIDGMGDNFLYAGDYIDSLSLQAALKGYVSGTVDLVGFTEGIGQTASAVVMPNAGPLVFQNGSVTFDGKVFTYVRNFNFKLTNNMHKDGYGIGSLDRSYALKNKFQVSGDFQLRLDSNAYAERAKVASAAFAPLTISFRGNAIANSMYEMMNIEMPYLNVDVYDTVDNSGILDAKITYKSYNPTGSYNYDAPLTITLITIDSAAY